MTTSSRKSNLTPVESKHVVKDAAILDDIHSVSANSNLLNYNYFALGLLWKSDKSTNKLNSGIPWRKYQFRTRKTEITHDYQVYLKLTSAGEVINLLNWHCLEPCTWRNYWDFRFDYCKMFIKINAYNTFTQHPTELHRRDLPKRAVYCHDNLSQFTDFHLFIFYS